MKKLKLSKDFFLISFLALFKLLIHLFTNTNYDLHRDSFLYYSLGQHLAWGYSSVPPFIGAMAKISTVLFGHNAFGLNFFPALVGAISVIIISLIVKELGGGRMAIIIASVAYIVSPAYLRTDTLFQPVAFDQFFWLLSAYFMVRLINTENPRYWIHLGIVWGIGFMTKYLIAVYAFSFFISLILSNVRRLYFNRFFLIGALTGLIIILPNLFWQYFNNWPVFHHLHELYNFQLVNVTPFNFLFDQITMNIQGLMIWMTGLVCLIMIKEERRYIIISITSLLVILFLLYTQGKSYYSLGLYPLLFATGAYCIEKYWVRWGQIVIVITTILIALPLVPLSLPVFSLQKIEVYTKNIAEISNRWDDGEIHNIPQDFADMTGWKDLSQLVIDTYLSLTPAEQKNCNIYTENYGQAGAIKFYGHNYNIPEPICFSDNFLFWAPDNIAKDNLIYVNDEIGDIVNLYHHYKLKGEINDKYFRESGVKVYYCTEPVDSFKDFYKNKIVKFKGLYKRI